MNVVDVEVSASAATEQGVRTQTPKPAPRRAARLRVLGRRGVTAVSWTAFIGLAALFVAFRPVSLGGTTTYTFIVGTSMEPGYHTGDLAVVTRQDRYAVGDIVSFHPSAAPDGMIIHRLVGGDAVTGFVTQGDNRNDPDPDRTPAAQLVGKAVVVVPHAATVLNAIRQPLVLGALAAVLVTWIAWDWMERRAGKDGRA